MLPLSLLPSSGKMQETKETPCPLLLLRLIAARSKNAVHAPRGLLEFYADPATRIHNPVFASGKKLVVFCATGGRSTLAAKTLVDMGVPNVVNLAGGFSAWREAGGRVLGA